MEKVIITGASSFIGQELIGRLNKERYEIIAVVRHGSSDKIDARLKSQIRIVECDMLEYCGFPSIIKKCDIFISLAWNGTRGSSRDDAVRQKENYLHSIQALHAAAQMGCRLFMSAGSQAEYGNINGMITEETICHPNTEYGRWKLAFYNDAIAFCRKNGISFIEPRFFSLYGENDAETTMVIDIIKKMLANKPCALTKCIQNWDYLYISDAVEGIITLLQPGCEDGAYNFGSGDVRQLKSYVDDMYRITGSHSELQFGAVQYPATGMVSIWPDVEKLRSAGWMPKTSFDAGIRKVIEKYRRSGNEDNISCDSHIQ